MDADPKTTRIVEARLVRQGRDEDAFDRAFWQRAGHEAKFAAMWDMVREAQLIKGHDGEQPRLQRSIAALIRREG